MASNEENLAQQLDEIEALSAIYAENVILLENNSVDVVIREEEKGDGQADLTIRLHVSFPEQYPSNSPPIYELSAPFLRGTHKSELCGFLEDIYLENMGTPIVFMWVERIREYLQDRAEDLKSQTEASRVRIAADLEQNLRLADGKEGQSAECPEIVTGNCIEDRKSVFQGHYAKVSSVSEVKAVISKLMENRKIANATHNMHAYRIRNKDNLLLQDCDDDGESQAGGRMLHLLDVLGVENTLVVVTRWYGGIHLGPDRFKHINNAARGVLELSGAIPSKK